MMSIRGRAEFVLVAAIALGASSGSLHAQALEIGLSGGQIWSKQVTTDLTLCNMNGCGPTTMWPSYGRSAWIGGVIARLELSDRFAVRLQPRLALKGFGPGPGTRDRRVDSRYLEFPLLAELRIVRYGPASFVLGGGVAPGVLVDCGTSGTTVDGEEEGDCEGAGGNSLDGGPAADFDFGWVVAPTLRFDIGGSATLSLEGSYTRGLIEIEPEEPGTTTNRSFVLALGLSRTVASWFR